MAISSADEFADVIRRLGSVRSDEEAWKGLSSYLWPVLLATSYRILRGNLALSEDASQEALLRLFRLAPFEQFADNPAAFRSYALAVGRNTALRYLSRILGEQKFSENAEAGEKATLDENPELLVIRSNLLAQCIVNLEVGERNMLELLLEGYNISEIASRLGLKYSATAVRIYRLRNKLAKLLRMNDL
jgi:RNA polymerase sigma factor (sigma-70 family)